MILATFVPQEWYGDSKNKTAIPHTSQPEIRFDVTSVIVAMGREKALALRDDTFETDALTEYGPDLVKYWKGPFYVKVQEQIARIFAENKTPVYCAACEDDEDNDNYHGPCICDQLYGGGNASL